MEQVPILRMDQIVKHFPGVLAVDHVDFQVGRGEVHALLGENGAGKTTLMNLLYGIHRPDAGAVYVKGKKVSIRSPKDAIGLGIGMVHQNFKLVESHTVCENILLGLKNLPVILKVKSAEKDIEQLSKHYDLPVDPRAKIWQLSMGERQRVEILKTLYRGADILILDEPTSVLTPLESKHLFDFLRKMTTEGKSVIFITHKLEEVMAVSDSVTVLRAGRVVGTVATSATTKSDLATMMVGRKVLFTYERRGEASPNPVLEVRELRVLNDKGLPALKAVSFTVHAGEIFGVAGVAGNGQRELAESITGLRRVSSGQIIIDGQDSTGRTAKHMIEHGVAYVPEDRIKVGAPQTLSIAENLVLRTYRYEPFSKGLLLRKQEIEANAEKLIPEFNIITPSKDAVTRTLSGGNLQKLILARELSGKPKLIVALYPTRGVDVGATEYVRGLLLKQREMGAGILLISEDLEEIFSLSDRIAVLYDGQIMGVVPAESAKIEEIGLMMGGALKKMNN
jgi:simple sugar transport system ATP-binding protein